MNSSFLKVKSVKVHTSSWDLDEKIEVFFENKSNIKDEIKLQMYCKKGSGVSYAKETFGIDPEVVSVNKNLPSERI